MTAINGSQGRLFGRRMGRPISARQSRLMRDRLADLSLDLKRPFSWDQMGKSTTGGRAWLEIGFGGGEHLVHMAALLPDVNFIGCEPFVNGVAKVLSVVEETGLKNIRLFQGDAFDAIGWLPDGSIDVVCLLYPDPWPKRRHWKRRLIAAGALEELARVIRPGGEVRFVSDIASYVNWTLRHFAGHPNFCWTARRADDWRQPFADWPGTRYEAKALLQRRIPAYLTFRRVGGDNHFS
jgi:tRNA (guanine-N7-)-methyltransferase